MPRPALTLVVLFLSTLALDVSPPKVFAASSNAKVAVHVQNRASKAALICRPADEGGAAPTDIPCNQYVTAGNLGTGYDVYVSVGEADSTGVAGLSFGIDYDGVAGQGIDVIGPWTLCATGLEFPSSTWPAPGQGNRITWNLASCSRLNIDPSGYHGIAGSFYVYAYSPDTFSITEHMLLQSGPELTMANCNGVEIDLSPTNAGSAGFSNGSLPGFNPCAGSYVPPICSISHTVLDFGTVVMGGNADLSFSITNTGDPGSVLTGSIGESCAEYSIVSGGGAFDLAAGQSRTVTIRFSPTSIGVFVCTIDPGTDCPPVNIIGSSAPPPDIAVSPEHLSATLFTGETSMQVLSIKNAGDSDLFWNIPSPAGFLDVSPGSGTLAPGSSADLEVLFDAAGLFGGDYSTDILIQSNDPDEPVVSVPAHLTVIGVPDIDLLGLGLESTVDYNVSGAVTGHTFSDPGLPPDATATLELVAEGDYSSIVETATVIAEGVPLGSVGGAETDCIAIQGTFEIDAALLTTLLADGVIQIQVANSVSVGAFCPINRHTVRLRFSDDALVLDFAEVFLGSSGTRTIEIANKGTADLNVSSVASDNPLFVPSPATLVLAPGTSQIVEINFTPVATGAQTGVLTILSNDPDEGARTVDLLGVGALPPDIAVAPASLSETLSSRQSSTQILTLSNLGGSDLEFLVNIVGIMPAGAITQPFQGLSTGDPSLSNNPPSGELQAPGPETDYIGIPGDFENLAPSPATMTCVAEDPSAGVFYAQADQATGFFRFRITTNTWETLSSSPIFSGNNGGAVVLDQKVYTVYAGNSSEIGVYDIAGDSWSTTPYPLHVGTNCIATDGTYLYLVEGIDFVRYDPSTNITTTLASPPIPFSLWGSLEHLGGRIFGHQGNAGAGFAQYDIGTDSWTSLPNAPSGLVMGSAMDVVNRDFYCYGNYGGTNLCRYSIDEGIWSVSTIPFFPVYDGGMAWFGSPAAVYFVEGEFGLGLARLLTDPIFVAVDPLSGSIPVSGSLDLDVQFRSLNLIGGDYSADIHIDSNDPDEPRVTVPVQLTIIGTPDIHVSGELVVLESVQAYTGSGSQTFHSIPVSLPPPEGGFLDLFVDGDYGDGSEIASVSLEGTPLGSAGSTGTDCAFGSATFSLSPSLLAAAAADGVIEVMVQNSPNVNDFCALNRHTVRIRYSGLADTIDFGQVLIGGSEERGLIISNLGSETLNVTGVSVNNPVFSLDTTGPLSLLPGQSQSVVITYTPPGGIDTGTLTVSSNDPDEPTITVGLLGEGTVAPDISVDPTSLTESLFTGATSSQVLTLSNLGGGGLDFEVLIQGSLPPGAITVPFAGLSPPAPGLSDNPEPPAAAPGSPDFVGAPGEFEALASSPAPLTCLAADPGQGIVYAQANQGLNFYRYLIASDTWESLPSSPLFSGNNGGAVILDNKVYTCYTDNSSQLGVYDIPSETWSVIANPIGVGTGNIATDGTYLYLARSFSLVRMDPDTGLTDVLASPPFSFQSWGGLRHLNGVLYGHQGNGGTLFAMYTISSDTWTSLPNIPGPAVLGAAIDPRSADYFTYGGYGGNNFYRYSIDEGFWTVSTIPFFSLGDGGLVWMSFPAGIYFVQGEGGFGFARHLLGPNFIGVEPTSGSVEASAATDLTVLFDATSLAGGDYFADIVIQSNDPDEPLLVVPAQLTVTGVPDIVVSEAFLDFGEVLLGEFQTRSLMISNAGSDPLDITGVAADNADYTPSLTSFSLPPGETRELVVSFVPSALGTRNGILTIDSNDPDEGTIPVSLLGAGVEAPDIAVSPSSFTESLNTGDAATQTLTLFNNGGSTLNWDAAVAFSEASMVVSASAIMESPPRAVTSSKEVAEEPPLPPAPEHLYLGEAPIAAGEPQAVAVPGPPLEDLLAEFNANFTSVTGAIPGRFDFLDGISGISIPDGGNDMYDGGNFLATNLGGPIPYSDNTVATSPYLGIEGRYFTRKVPGLFAMVADMTDVSFFTISGNLGADGGGSVDGAVLEIEHGGITYRGFVKRVFNAGDPSVNHLIILAENPVANHEFDTNTDSDFHRMTGLAPSTRLYYLLYAGGGGAYIDNSYTLNIMNIFLNSLNLAPSWIGLDPSTGSVPAGGSASVDVTFDATGLTGGDYPADILVMSNDPDEGTVVVPTLLTVSGVPRIEVTGEDVLIESVVDYSVSMAVTQHSLETTVPPPAGGTLELIAVGDYGLSSETATISAEGTVLGTVGGAGTDCTPADGTFPLSPALLSALAADGVVDVQVTNSSSVGSFCSTNRHTVRLHYSGTADPLDFGEVFLGYSGTRELTVLNTGTEVLNVTGFAVDNPDFSVDPGGFSVNPGEERLLRVTFTPSGLGGAVGTLTISSNDPGGDLTVNLAGEGVTPAIATLTPESITSNLFSGESETQTAILGNTGGSDLDFTIDLESVSLPEPTNSPKIALHAKTRTVKSAMICTPEGSGGGAPDIPCSQYVTQVDLFSGYDIYMVVANAPATGVTGVQCGISYNSALGQGVDVHGWVLCATGLEFPSTSWPASGSGNTMTWGSCQSQEISPNGVHAVAGAFYVYAYDPDTFSVTEHMELIGSPEVTYSNCGGAETPLSTADLGKVRFSPGALQPGLNPCTQTGGGGVPGWLSVAPEAGSVPPAANLNLDVTTDAAGLNSGLYQARVLVRSDDPANPTLTLPVDLTVEGAPDIEASPNSFDFGPRLIGSVHYETLTVANAGVDPLVVSAITSDNPEFATNVSGFTVSPGRDETVLVSYTPATAGPVTGSLSINSNDPDETMILVPLSGEGITPPVASLSPTSITSTLFSGDSETQIATLENTGGSDLEFDANISVGSGPGPGPAPDLGEAKVALHVQNHASKSSYICTSAVPTIPCSQYTTEGNLATGYDVYVVVGNVDSLGVGGVRFGIDYNGNPGQGVDVVGTWNLCASGLEFPSSSWPGSGSGNVVTWNTSDCPQTTIAPNGVHAVAGAFYTYAYSPDSFSITEHMELVTPSLAYANCNGQEIDLPTDAGGSASFALGPGYNPCLGGGPGTPSWLSLDPTSGTVPPGSSVDLEVTTDAGELAGGVFEAIVNLSTNDPLAPLFALPVTLNVTDAARIGFGAGSMDFGTVFVGATPSATLTVYNTGTEALTVSSVVPGLADYSVDPPAFNLDPDDSTAITIIFAPIEAGDRGTDLVFDSNDPDSPHTVSLTGTGLEPPVIDASPLSYVGAALPGGEKVKTLTVCNTGGPDLVYAVANRPEAASDPDGFGHVWFDSDAPGGPVFDWVDISGVGAPIFEIETDDENAGPFPVGFSFPFYENTFTEFQVCSNGWLSFTNTQSNFSNQALPTANSTVPENLLAVLWDDLVFDPAIGSSAYYHNDGSRLVVQFNDLRRFDEMNPPYYSYEVLLYPNGDIVYQYLSVGNDGESATVGIQNASRDDGLQVVHNGPYLHPNLAVRFTVPAAWLGFSPAAGTVSPGSCTDVDVIMDASSLGAGDYAGEIFLTSNDPFTPGLLGDVLFHVGSVDPDTSEVSPGTLNAASHGRWITAEVELPAPYDPADVVLSTVLIQGTVPADSTFDVISDFNENGVLDRTFKFNRTEFIMTLPEDVDMVEVVVTGEIRDTIYFTVRDSMRIVRPKMLSPDGGETLLGGAVHEVRWSVPSGWDGITADLYFSSDLTTWNLVASGIPGNSYLWQVPAEPAEAAGIKVEIHDEYGMLGSDASDGPFAVSTQVTSVGPDQIPAAYALLQNMPNPFSGSTTIRYDLPADAPVVINIFDVSGRSVRRLVDRSMPAGRHQAVWDGRNQAGQNVASGIYFYRMKTPEHQDTKRLFILR